MSQEAYSRAGVSQSAADSAIAALVGSLRQIDTGRPRREVELPGHFASVLRIDERTGIAICTDGVGTKLVLAEELGRWDTVGIDCIAMNANDMVCVGAEPIAMVDYIAVPSVDEDVLRELGKGLRRGAELAGIEIPGGELAQLGTMVNGLDLSGACVGTVALDAILTGAQIAEGDSIIGIPSSGLHSNGYTLAREALAGLDLADSSLGRPLAEILLEPTEIYVRAALELIGSDAGLHGLAHITGDGLNNLLRLSSSVGYSITDPLEVPPVFGLIAERGKVPEGEMYEVFNMGCGFCAIVAEPDAGGAVEVLASHHPGSRVIGTVTGEAGEVRMGS